MKKLEGGGDTPKHDKTKSDTTIIATGINPNFKTPTIHKTPNKTILLPKNRTSTPNNSTYDLSSCPKCPNDNIPGGKMILCEGDCEEWFHYECLGWGEDVELDNFTCEDCLTKLHTKMVNMLTPIPKNENQKIIVEYPAGRGEKIIIQSTPKKGGGSCC